MAQPIPLRVASRDLQRELNVRLQEAPVKHAEAILAAYEVLQSMHDHGVLEVMRGTLGGGKKILEQAVVVGSGPEAIRAIRNVLLLVRALGEIEPALLSDPPSRPASVWIGSTPDAPIVPAPRTVSEVP